MTYAYRTSPEEEWTSTTKVCPICLGTGKEPRKRKRPWPDGVIHFHVKGGPNHMSMDEIMDRIEEKR